MITGRQTGGLIVGGHIEDRLATRAGDSVVQRLNLRQGGELVEQLRIRLDGEAPAPKRRVHGPDEMALIASEIEVRGVGSKKRSTDRMVFRLQEFQRHGIIVIGSGGWKRERPCGRYSVT